jgi:hypothetical protein
LGAVPGGLSVFGSSAIGPPAFSTDLDTLQSPAWLFGWDDALNGGLPVLEDMNALDYVITSQIAEILQDGIPPYDSGTNYFTDSFVSYGGKTYQSLTDNNLGNLPTDSTKWKIFANAIFWCGTDTSQASEVNTYKATGVTGFPANANIAAGTLLAFVASKDNTNGHPSGCTLEVNSQAALNIYDNDGFPIQSGMIRKGMTVVLIYNGTQWNLVNPRKERRQWSLMADLSATNFISTGMVQGTMALSGTGGSLAESWLAGLLTTPYIMVSVDNTSGHEAKYTPANLLLPVYNLMNLFIHIPGFGTPSGGAQQSFIGYASGDPDLTGTDPLANLTGWGIWFKQVSANNYSMSLVNNNGNATSTITSIATPITGSGEFFVNLSANCLTGIITCEVIYDAYVGASIAINVSSNSKVPSPSTTTQTAIKPYVYLRANSAFAYSMALAEMVGDYGI